MESSTVVVIAAILLVYAALSRRMEGTPITGAMVFVACGFLTGSELLGWLHLTINDTNVSALAEATLVVVLFTDASRIDLRPLRKDFSVPARLLGIGLPLTIAAGALAASFVLPDITWAEALVLAVILAPTDAALGQAVITDENVPTRIRQALNIESGLNDGLCVPLLTIALAIAQTDAGETTGTHAVRLVIEAIGWGVVGGCVAGGAAAAVLRWSRKRGWIERQWIGVVPVIAAAAAFGIADSSGGSGFIAAFVGGAVFGALTGRDPEDAHFAEEVGGALNGVTLIVFGGVVLSAVWAQIGVREVLYAVLSLTLVRMIPVAIAMIGAHARPTTVLLLGWFGPRGLASIVFAVVVVEASGLPHTNDLVIAVTVTVALSVFAHGLSAAPLARRYASWQSSRRTNMESKATPRQRWRHGRPFAPEPQ
jgi:sodium/hydrogen antiporter